MLDYLKTLWCSLFTTPSSILNTAYSAPNREARRAFEKAPLRDSDWMTRKQLWKS